MASPERTLKSMLADQFVRSVGERAAGLRRLADDIELHGTQIAHVGMPGVASAAAISARIVHMVMWGLANASVDNIVSAAAEYDFHMGREGSDG